MKKQITIAALGLLTMAGGSWLAAQQRDSARKPRAEGPADVSRAEPLFADAEDEPVSASATTIPDSPEAASPLRTTNRARRAEGTQDARGPETRVQDRQVARFPGGPGVDVQVFGQQWVMPDMQQRWAAEDSMNATRLTPEDAARMRAFQDAIRELREAENTDDKSAAREQVTKLVSEQLDADLANREKELAAIEQRAKELRKQLDERKTAKPELLKMLVMLIDNPQVGLGIPPEWMQMLMRGQPNQYRQALPGTRSQLLPILPAQPPQPAEPPASRY